MYRILCYGDSNTWGFNPVNGLRLQENDRWPGVLRSSLGSGFEIIEDGLNGRAVLSCAGMFSDVMHKNEPLDVIIIFLGINDIFFENEVKIGDIIDGIKNIIRTSAENVQSGFTKPEVILIGTVPINPDSMENCFYEQEAAKVEKLGEKLSLLAGSEGCGFIDSGRIILSSELDGIHLDAEAHRKLGRFVSAYVRTFLGNTNLQKGS